MKLDLFLSKAITYIVVVNDVIQISKGWNVTSPLNLATDFVTLATGSHEPAEH